MSLKTIIKGDHKPQKANLSITDNETFFQPVLPDISFIK